MKLTLKAKVVEVGEFVWGPGIKLDAGGVTPCRIPCRREDVAAWARLLYQDVTVTLEAAEPARAPAVQPIEDETNSVDPVY